MSAVIDSFDVYFEQDLVDVKQRTRIIASMLDFTQQDQARFSAAVSEIARNALQFGKGGTVDFCIEGAIPDEWLAIIIRDRGPGIPDLDAILNPQDSSSKAVGQGIIACKRLLPSHFNIETGSGQGTRVTIGKSLPIAKQPFSLERLDLIRVHSKTLTY